MPAPLSPSEQIAHSTVRIETEYPDGTKGTGTGFFFAFAKQADAHVPAIVTNKHVVDGAIRGRFHLSTADGDGNPIYGRHEVFTFERFATLWLAHPDPKVDLCAMPIAPLLTQASAAGKRIFFIHLDMSLIPKPEELGELGVMEDILMAGYPNGIWDHVNNMPVLRKGVTATHPNLDWNGRPEFMIDAACFPGSSGSPVFLFNLGGYATRGGGMAIGTRLKLLGILYAGPQYTATGEIRIVQVPTAERSIALTTLPNNLGIVIKARQLEALEIALKTVVDAQEKMKRDALPEPATPAST